MLKGTLYMRIIEADRDRGHVMLFSWIKPVVQRTASQVSSASAISRGGVTSMMATAQARFGPDRIVDVTDASMVKKLAVIFGETAAKSHTKNKGKVSSEHV